MRIALLAPTGYLTAELGGEPEPKRGLVTANRPAAGAWETWTVEKHDDGSFSLKSTNGFYLCAEGGGNGVVYANRKEAKAWERFTAPGGKLEDAWAINILCADGTHYLSVETAGQHVVNASGATTYFTVDVIDPDPPEPEPGSELPKLVKIQGHRMIAEDGSVVYGRGADAFLLYKRFLDGDDIEPFLKQHAALGFNLLRVMGMFESLGGFDPRQYSDYYNFIPGFCARCEEYGLYVLWTCCAATQGIFNTDSAVIAHITKTVDQLKTTNNALTSPVNEQGQHNNSINLQRVKNEVDFGWLLHDMGSYGMDIPCSPPFGTHAVLHVNRRYSNSVRDCCILDNPNYVNDHLEVGLDEPDRYGDEGNTNVQHAADAAGTAYTALFFVFHSMQGERAEVLRGNTLDCATKAITAMKGH